MSVTRQLVAALASIALFSALWISSAQLATPGAASPTGLAPAAAQEQGGSPDAAEVPPFKPVARVSSLMAGIGSAFGSMREVFPLPGDEHRLDRIVAWSEVIAELSNVHMRHRRKPDYLEMAADTRSIALELARAARADMPDEAQLATLFETLDNSCSTCHDADH
ncbi:MAG: hypothetical protein DRQ55_08745 [Planctomycetota bacterium]|nr:MAG: hypothetical protein DRQ55_08745 [Planctomycetota bacterium]